MDNPVEKFKEHVKRHKIAYSCGATVVVTAGITALIMRGTGLRGGPGVEGLRGGPVNTSSFTFGNKQTIKITTVLEREGRGHPGYIIRCVETKRIFDTQKEAATAFGVTESLMSGHVSGKFPDIDGFHFERVNLVPQPA